MRNFQKLVQYTYVGDDAFVFYYIAFVNFNLSFTYYKNVIAFFFSFTQFIGVMIHSLMLALLQNTIQYKY